MSLDSHSVFEHIYSNNIFNKKIAILGIEPPPLGGISIHVQRVAKKFRDQKNSVYIFDTEKRRGGYFRFLRYIFLLTRFLWRVKPDIVYHHTVTCFFNGRLIELPLLILLKWLLGYQFIMIDHVSRFFTVQCWWYKKVLSFLFSYFDQQVLIGNSTHQAYGKNKIFLGKNYCVEAAFLPPDLTQEQAILASYPTSLQFFLKKHTPIIIANGSKMALWHGNDLYGFDLSVALIAKLKKEYPDVGLVLALSNKGDQAYYEQFCEKIKKNSAVYLLYNCTGELWPLLKQADIFVRPTLSDGASVSLQEAIYVGTPVVASDVCVRPKGAVLFKCGDRDSFYQKVCELLQTNKRAIGNEHEPTLKKSKINQQHYYSNTQ